jgi:eukaryotic-like serine/threonine-protein kinase
MSVSEKLGAALADRYRIERELGAGGMATVYLAQDLRHDRKVALKVLRPDLAAVIGAERFLQEIRTTANLQHPHILTLHDSGQVDGTVFYVMPYVEGESLRDRLTRDKQLPIDEVLRVAREVADALGYAHERGVIHRDIKPENILLQRGHALVADFGIALAASRTGSSRMTETGMSLGTPHYMSPEQAMGERELGPRSDVYALGCVCYEMLCGEPPFTGPTPQAIVARVMTEAPRSLRSQRQTVPENVEAAVLQALEKLPADRFGTATEFAAALGQTGFTRATIAAPRSMPAARAGIWKGVAIGFASLAALLLVLLFTSRQSDEPAPGPVLRFEVQVPDSIDALGMTLLPDGTGLLVHATSRAYLYRFADMSWTAAPLAELKEASTSLSPDGRMVAFVDAARVLKVAALAGGSMRTLADGVRGVRWETDGFIYLIRRSAARDRLARVRPEGGALEELVVTADSIRRLQRGVLLPGGRMIYTEAPSADGWQDSRALAVDLSSRAIDTIALAPGSSVFGYAPTGHLLVYGREDIHAVAFDPATLAVLGAPVQLLSSISVDVSYDAGMLSHTLTTPGGPALFDRSGRRRDLPDAIAPNSWGFDYRMSPTGQAFAFWRYQSPADRWDVFTYQLPTGPLRRLTSDSAGENTEPSWSADGRMVRFVAGRQDRRSVYQAPWDASGAPALFLTRPGGLEVLDALPSGRVLAQVSGNSLVLLGPGANDSAVTLAAGAVQPESGRISPDGRWVAYSAIELGRREVFVRPTDGGASRWQISRIGGDRPFWSRSGRELFFFSDDSIRVAGLGRGVGFQASEPRPLFRLVNDPGFAGFDVLPGDSLFVLYANSSGSRVRIIVIANFLSELRALTGSPRASAP